MKYEDWMRLRSPFRSTLPEGAHLSDVLPVTTAPEELFIPAEVGGEARPLPYPETYDVGRWLSGEPGADAGRLESTVSQGLSYLTGGIGNVLQRKGSGEELGYLDYLFGTLDLPVPGPMALKYAGGALAGAGLGILQTLGGPPAPGSLAARYKSQAGALTGGKRHKRLPLYHAGRDTDKAVREGFSHGQNFELEQIPGVSWGQDPNMSLWNFAGLRNDPGDWPERWASHAEEASRALKVMTLPEDVTVHNITPWEYSNVQFLPERERMGVPPIAEPDLSDPTDWFWQQERTADEVAMLQEYWRRGGHNEPIPMRLPGQNIHEEREIFTYDPGRTTRLKSGEAFDIESRHLPGEELSVDQDSPELMSGDPELTWAQLTGEFLKEYPNASTSQWDNLSLELTPSAFFLEPEKYVYPQVSEAEAQKIRNLGDAARLKHINWMYNNGKLSDYVLQPGRFSGRIPEVDSGGRWFHERHGGEFAKTYGAPQVLRADPHGEVSSVMGYDIPPGQMQEAWRENPEQFSSPAWLQEQDPRFFEDLNLDLTDRNTRAWLGLPTGHRMPHYGARPLTPHETDQVVREQVSLNTAHEGLRQLGKSIEHGDLSSVDVARSLAKLGDITRSLRGHDQPIRDALKGPIDKIVENLVQEANKRGGTRGVAGLEEISYRRDRWRTAWRNWSDANLGGGSFDEVNGAYRQFTRAQEEYMRALENAGQGSMGTYWPRGGGGSTTPPTPEPTEDPLNWMPPSPEDVLAGEILNEPLTNMEMEDVFEKALSDQGWPDDMVFGYMMNEFDPGMFKSSAEVKLYAEFLDSAINNPTSYPDIYEKLNKLPGFEKMAKAGPSAPPPLSEEEALSGEPGAKALMKAFADQGWPQEMIDAYMANMIDMDMTVADLVDNMSEIEGFAEKAMEVIKNPELDDWLYEDLSVLPGFEKLKP